MISGTETIIAMSTVEASNFALPLPIASLVIEVSCTTADLLFRQVQLQVHILRLHKPFYI